MSWWRRGERVVSVRPSGAQPVRGGTPHVPDIAPDSSAPRAVGPSAAPADEVRRRAIWVAAAIAVFAALGLVAAVLVTHDGDQGAAADSAGATAPPAAVVAGATKPGTPPPSPTPTASATKKPTHGAGASYVNEEFRYAIDGPGGPRRFGRDYIAGWGSGVYFLEYPRGDQLTIIVLARREVGVANDARTAVEWLESTPSQYRQADITLVDTKTARVNGLHCVIARSRQPDVDSGEALVVLDYWVPGNGHAYLVRGVAATDDWHRVSRRAIEIIGTFECW